jgi:tetratricopeptide (TPR) repeat protein
MDALQAFVCAIQLDKKHYSAWLNLGVLYEQDNQLEEALKCYKCATRFRHKKKSIPSAKRLKMLSSSDENDEEASELDKDEQNDQDLSIDELLDELDDNESILSTDEEDRIYKEEFRLLVQRIKLLSSYFELAAEKIKDQAKKSQHQLPTLRDAFSLQIPADLRQKIANNAQQSTPASICLSLSLNSAHHAASANQPNYLTLKQAQSHINTISSKQAWVIIKIFSYNKIQEFFLN